MSQIETGSKDRSMVENDSRQSPADIVAAQDEYRTHVWNICLWPRRWQTCDPGMNLPWQSVELDNSQRSEVPQHAGVYSLVVQPGIAGHPACSYLMYVGQTKNLRRRFSDYLSAERRPKVARLLEKYRGYIQFFYTGVDERQLDDMEGQLINAFVPPCISNYTGIMNKIVGAF